MFRRRRGRDDRTGAPFETVAPPDEEMDAGATIWDGRERRLREGIVDICFVEGEKSR